MNSMSGSPDQSTDPPPPPDLDALLNRANLALARSRRLVEAWLPLSGAADGEEDEEDEELFKPVPEL